MVWCNETNRSRQLLTTKNIYNMKKFYYLLFPFIIVCFYSNVTKAGNPDRAGQAGAYELTINPWARSSGWHGLNTGSVRGIESMNLNPGGLAFTKKTEVLFTTTQYLKGSDISINAIGFSQKVGESGVIGVNIVSMDFGDIENTTVLASDGGIGSFSPQFLNLGVGYSKSFSTSIHTGFVLRVISEAIDNVSATGIAFDAGVQYVTGVREEIKFGIALRNVGPGMSYKGDGLVLNVINVATGEPQTSTSRSQTFEIPTSLNIGASYDFKLAELHRLTTVGNFTSNSFSDDQIGLGVEYGFKNQFMLRAGYNYEDGIEKYETAKTASKGLAVGGTIEVPLGKGGATIGIDYSYRATYNFDGTHSFGARINL